MKIADTFWQWLDRHSAEAGWGLFWAFVIGAAFDLASPDSRIRAGIRHIKNYVSGLSIKYLQNRIAKLQIYRNTLRSYADMAIYLGILRAILAGVICMSAASLLMLGDSIGFIPSGEGKFLASCMYGLIIGTGLAILRIYSPTTDTRQEFQKLIMQIEKEITALQGKLDKRTR
jgi:hypothetical protein